jgi:hypothetical protein
MSLTKALINSNEVRSDGLTSIARHGSRQASGSYTAELSNGSFDMLMEAVMRSTWVAATAITQATMTSITTTTTTIVAAAGSWITQGVRVGDVVRLTGFATTANNNINLRVKAVTASTITVHGTAPLVLDASPDASFTLTILKKLKNATTPTKRTFYIDEYNQDIDLSEVYGGCRFISMKISGTPDGMAMVEFGVLGASGTPLAMGSSPYYIAPTQFTSIPLVFADATISYNGSDIANATAFELTYVIAAATQPIIGSSVTPDVFDNNASLTGSISIVRQDLAALTALSAETEMQLHVLLVEPEAEPKDCISFYVPRLKLTAVSGSIGGDGALVDQLPWTAGVPDTTVTATDASLLTICTSAA